MIDEESVKMALSPESAKSNAVVTNVGLKKRKMKQSSELSNAGPTSKAVRKKMLKGKKDSKKDFYNIVEENHKVSTLFDLKNDPDFQISRNGAIADDYLSLERAVGTSTILYDALVVSEKQKMTDVSQLYEMYGLKQPVEKVTIPENARAVSSLSSLTVVKKTTIYERLNLPFNSDDSIIRCLALYEGLDEELHDGSPNLLKRDIYEKCLKTVYGISVTRLKTLLDFVNDMWRGKARAVFGYLTKANNKNSGYRAKVTKYLRKIRSTTINETSDMISDVHRILEERIPTLECERKKKMDISKIFESLKEASYNEDIIAVFKKYVFAVQFFATNVFEGCSLSTTVSSRFGYSPEEFERLHAFYRASYTTWSTPQRGLAFVEDALSANVGADYDGYLQNNADESHATMGRIESFRQRVRTKLLSAFFGKNSRTLAPAHMYVFASTLVQKSKEPAFRNRCDDAFFLNAYCLTKGVNINVYCVSTGSKRVVLGKSFERLEPNPDSLRDLSLFYNKGKYDILMEYCSTAAERQKSADATEDGGGRKQRSASESKVRFYRTMKSYNSLFTRSLVVNRELQRWVETVATQLNAGNVVATIGCANRTSNHNVGAAISEHAFEKKIDRYRRSMAKKSGAQKKTEPATAVPKSISYVKNTPDSDDSSAIDDESSDVEDMVINDEVLPNFEKMGSDLVYTRNAWDSWSSDLVGGIRFTNVSALIANGGAEKSRVSFATTECKSDVSGNPQPKIRKFVFLTFPEIVVSFGSGHAIRESVSSTTSERGTKKAKKPVKCTNLYRHANSSSSNAINESCVIASYDVSIIYDKKVPKYEQRSNYNMLYRYENMTIKRAFEFEPYREDISASANDANAPLSASSFKVSDDMVKSGLVDRVLKNLTAKETLSCARKKLHNLSNAGGMSFDVAFQVWASFCKIQISDLENTTFVLDDDVMIQSKGKSPSSLPSDAHAKKLFDVLSVSSQLSDFISEKNTFERSNDDGRLAEDSNTGGSSSTYTSDSSTYTSEYSSSEADTDSTSDDDRPPIETAHAQCSDKDIFDIVNTLRSTVTPRKGSKLKMDECVVSSKAKPDLTFEAPSKNRNAVSLWIPSECLRDRNFAWSRKESIKNAATVNLGDICSGPDVGDDNFTERLSLLGDLLDVVANDHRVVVVGVGANASEAKYDVVIPIVEDRKKYAHFSDMNHLFSNYATPDYFRGCSPTKYYAFAYRRYAEQKATAESRSKTLNKVAANVKKPETGSGGGGFWGYVFGGATDAVDTSSALENGHHEVGVVNSVKNQVGGTATAILNMGESLLDYVSHSKKNEGATFLRRCLHSNGFIVSVIFPKSDEISSIAGDSNISINTTYLRDIQNTVSSAISLLDRDEL